MIRVRWHTYDGAPTRREWLKLPGWARNPYTYAEFIGSHLREREGLPPDSHRVGERVLWFEWDMIRPKDVVEERFADKLAQAKVSAWAG